MILKKSIYILLIALLFSCKDDDCSDDGDTAINFTIFLNLETKNGDNFLDRENFDFNKLNVFDPENRFATDNFRVVERNGIRVLELSPLNQRNIIIEFENDQIANFQIQVLEIEAGDNCTAQITNYEVRSNNNTLLCSCELGEIITLEITVL